LEDKVFYHDRDIVWIKCGLNVGIETDGKGEFYLRPALILKKLNRRHYIVLFCTTTEKEGRFYFKIESHHPNLLKTKVILTQIKTIDKSRILERLVTLPEGEFQKIKNEFFRLVLNNSPKSFDKGEANAHK
jgi:mRNA interferase MazF